jgi:hypothetical protein
MSNARFWELIRSEVVDLPLHQPSLENCICSAIAFANEVGGRHSLYPIQAFLGNLGGSKEPTKEEKTWDETSS